MKIKKILIAINTFFNNILGLFVFFICIMVILGFVYNRGLHPSDDKILEIINKFAVNNYSIPYYVAERYLIWFNMRTFFFTLNYILTLFGIVASLMTVFYASKKTKDSDEKARHKNYIVFLSLLATCFTVANIFINAGTMANMSQHAWRQLDSCIIETIHKNELSSNEKDILITNKVIEIEKYNETFEH